ncbi:hypothetical protein N7451_012066 [Penicillium sp. IBT 35674x]|nr:hypothetical protein N7451_012066 [Penicillium sp. IBT 35674x]
MFFSDHGTPLGWRHNHGYGCHTPKWSINKDGDSVYIKYHFLANHGQKQFTADEAMGFSGEGPDCSKRDLWRAIGNGEEITWITYVQIMQPDEADTDNLGFGPIDVTKVWPQSQFLLSILIYYADTSPNKMVV